MKQLYTLFSCILCALLLSACTSTTATAPKATAVQQESARLQKAISAEYAKQTNHYEEHTLTGQRTTHSRILAAGGFIAGAIGGS